MWTQTLHPPKSAFSVLDELSFECSYQKISTIRLRHTITRHFHFLLYSSASLWLFPLSHCYSQSPFPFEGGWAAAEEAHILSLATISLVLDPSVVETQGDNPRHSDELRGACGVCGVCGARYRRATVARRPYLQPARSTDARSNSGGCGGVHHGRRTDTSGTCLASLGTWTARIVYLLHMWPIPARSCTCAHPPWMRTTNFSDTSGESTYTPSSTSGFSSWLTLSCSSCHSLGTRLVSSVFGAFLSPPVRNRSCVKRHKRTLVNFSFLVKGQMAAG